MTTPPHVASVLRLETDALAPLRSPVLLLALTGWFDIAEVATTALDRYAPAERSVTVGEIDPDPFYDFTQERPQVELIDGDQRVIRWPDNQFDVIRGYGSRDLVVLVGVEPHLAWATYADAVVHVARATGCEAAVTLGASIEPVPHTRPPRVTGSTTDPRLTERLGIGPPSHQGLTGVVGVIQTAFADASIPSVSLRVGIPHYLMGGEHPAAIAALHTHLAHVIGVPAPEHPGLADDIARWRRLHDETVDSDPQLSVHVANLERAYDVTTEAAIPSADDLGARFEDYLREHREDDS